MESIKQYAKQGLLRLGYRVERLPATNMGRFHPDVQAGMTVKDAEFYTRWSKPYPLFAAWLGEPEFRCLYEGIRAHTVVSPDRCYMLYALARYARQLDGDFAECGVYKGGTALLLSRILASSSVKRDLFLFDSFEGLPEPSQADTYYKGGEFSSTSAEAVANLVSEFGFARICKGWIPDTFRGLEDKRFAFVHVDVDLYKPTLDCCAFFWSRLVHGGVMLFDEYGFPSTRGEKDAVDEWSAGQSIRPISLISGQSMLLKP